MRIYLVAGEASGDLHAANLLRALRARAPGLEARALGGDALAAAGATLVRHNRDLNHFGFVEVVRHLPQILRLFGQLERDIAAYRPDAVVLVDYPGFNLRLARRLHARGVRVFYYIAPQVWAWKEGRLAALKAYVDRLYCILPFEPGWFAARGLEVDYVGHPLLDAIAQAEQRPSKLRAELGLGPEAPVLALLPGSRRNEVRAMLPTMLAAARPLVGRAELLIAAAPHLEPEFFAPMLRAAGVEARVVSNRTYDVLRTAQAALVTSGTATLETALWRVPQVLCYRVNALSYAIARRLVKLKYVGLPNLILDRPVIGELLQGALTVEALRAEAERLLFDAEARARLAADYAELRQVLGAAGASARTAELMLARLRG